MRDIKFRVWYKPAKAWADSHCYIGRLIPDRDIHPQIWSLTNDVANDLFEVEQFTGFCDKNRKEIYEGDVVLIAGSVCSIEWDEFSAQFNVKGSFGYGFSIFASQMEILGNVHEHPELLK